MQSALHKEHIYSLLSFFRLAASCLGRLGALFIVARAGHGGMVSEFECQITRLQARLNLIKALVENQFGLIAVVLGRDESDI